MKIYINKIKDTPEIFTKTYVADELDIGTDRLKSCDSIKTLLKVQKEKDNILVKVRMEFKIRIECDRCLFWFDKNCLKDFKLNLNIKSNQDIIDITDYIRQEIILSFPVKQLCQEDCKGLCIGCGVNLNQEICKCNKKSKIKLTI